MFAAHAWPVTLEAGSVRIRPLHRSDRAAWTRIRMHNRQWLQPWEPTNPASDAGVDFSNLLRVLKAQARAGLALPFAIAEKDPDGGVRFVGQLTISNIVGGSALSGTAGYWIDRARAGRNIVPLALALATDHCFRVLGLHRMEVNICPTNRPSLRVVEKLGFRCEGTRERYLHINGQWADHRSFALTSEEVPEGMLARVTPPVPPTL